ncbi:MAG: prolyl aminopeptidase [Burkholderiales bacterium]|jgi:proline iminopeptidase
MAVEQNEAIADVLYPPLAPYRTGLLDVGSGHRVYFEESGNPDGFPVLFVHGGPGSQTRSAHRRFFDPDFFRIVLFDQRGCGQSTPQALLADNTTAHLVADMERLRCHLNIGRWLLFGGSWGSTLSLLYAITYPKPVAGLVLRGVFLGSAAEVEWFLYGVRHFVPEAWAEFTKEVTDGVVAHYQRLVHAAQPELAMAAAQHWSAYETRVMEPETTGASASRSPSRDNLAAVQVHLHFLSRQFFLKPNELADNLWRVKDMAVIIVQGRMDLVCPPMTAVAVARGIPRSELRMVGNGSHSAFQREMAIALCTATRDMKTRFG